MLIFHFSAIDDIVLGYVVGIVEDLTATEVADKDESALDLESVVEMLTAYIPEAQDIPEKEVMLWMFNIAEQLQNLSKKGNHFELRKIKVDFKVEFQKSKQTLISRASLRRLPKARMLQELPRLRNRPRFHPRTLITSIPNPPE